MPCETATGPNNQSSTDDEAGGDADPDPLQAIRANVVAGDAESGCDSLRVALQSCTVDAISRELIQMTSQIVGNADTGALRVVLDASEAAERLGSLGSEPVLAQAVEY